MPNDIYLCTVRSSETMPDVNLLWVIFWATHTCEQQPNGPVVFKPLDEIAIWQYKFALFDEGERTYLERTFGPNCLLEEAITGRQCLLIVTHEANP